MALYRGIEGKYSDGKHVIWKTWDRPCVFSRHLLVYTTRVVRGSPGYETHDWKCRSAAHNTQKHYQ